MRIYLAGSIPKGDTETKEFVDWRDHYSEVLKKVFNAEFITPRAGEVDETDWMLVMGKDSRSIKVSDVTVVYAENKIGAGTAMEMVIAKYFKKPVITVIPKNTHHRQSNVVFDGKLVGDWVNPFIGAFSDFVIESIEEVVTIKDQLASVKVKDISIIDEAVARRELMLKD